MKAQLHKDRPDAKGSIVVSVIFHMFAIAAIASITFRYPLAAFFGIDKVKVPTERIQYVSVQAQPGALVSSGANDKRPPRKVAKPTALLAPTITPTTLPPIAPPTISVGAVAGTGAGSGAAPVGAATGLEPALPDSRIELKPNSLRLPLTTAQKTDSAVKAIFMAYREAEVVAEENRGRSPKDWTIERNGQKYGLDSQYIYLGKFKLPSAILAALPFNYGGVDGTRLIQARNADWIRNDIYMHSQGLSEDDFRAAVRRIRERKDKEKAEAAKQKAQPKAAPIVP